MNQLAPYRLGRRGRALAVAALVACSSFGCLRTDEPPLHAGVGDLDHLGPSPVLPRELDAVNVDLDGEATCGDAWLEPTLRIETPRGGLRISYLMDMYCGQKPALDVSVRGGTVKIVESTNGEAAKCKCSQAVHAAIRLDPGTYTVEIIRADQRRLLGKEQVEVPEGEPEEY